MIERIRHVSQVDRARLIEITNAANAAEGLSLPVMLSSPSQRMQNMPSILAWRDNGTLIAYVNCQVMDRVEIFILVHPEHRRKRIGMALLDEAKRACMQFGYDHLVITIDAKSQSANEFVKRTPAALEWSEYRLDLNPGKIDRSRPRIARLALRAATEDEIPV
jgi:GNAT superfamily N-acetyltransferase